MVIDRSPLLQQVSPIAKRILVYLGFAVAAFTPVWLNLLVLLVAWALLMLMARSEIALGVLLTIAAISISYLLHVAILQTA